MNPSINKNDITFDSGIHEECGIVGVYSPNEAATRIAFFGLFALQHRGQESAGFASWDGKTIRHKTAMGLISQGITEDQISLLPGFSAIGHTRYSTTGSSHSKNAQPIMSKGPNGELALAHNGNVVNSVELRRELTEWGCDFETSNDSEIIAHMLTYLPGSDWGQRCSSLMRRLSGAYSLTVLTNEGIMAIRDPLGVRPLCIGALGKGWVIASETCALDHVGAEFIREIMPGEAIMVNSKGINTIYQKPNNGRTASCIFENIYFARPDSSLDGKLVYTQRMEMGAELSRKYPVEADLVIGIPDSATAAAVGYSKASGIPYAEGVIKNRYAGRTFILPDQRLRELGVRRKLNPLPDIINNKRLIVVDDSIVRGTTTPHVVNLLKKSGAKEIHLRICAPPIQWPCHLGVDLASKRELIAANKSVEEIREYIGADSLGYLDIESLLKSVNISKDNVCLGCFNGNHPIPVQLEMDKLALEF